MEMRAGMAVLALASMLAPACTRADDGTAVPAASVTAAAPSAATAPSTPGTTPAGPSSAIAHPDFGVVPTSTPVPTGAVTCEFPQRPPVGMTAQIADPAAPVLTIAVPDGWSMQGGTGDIGAQLTGPTGLSARVTIAATTLDPQAAFADYADRLTERAAVSSVSVLPAELCAYSGQKLMGTLSDAGEMATEYVDRVLHIPTAGGAYLVAVHVEAPSETADFDPVSAQLTQDIEVRIP